MAYYGVNMLGEKFFCYIRCGLDGYKRMHLDYINNISASPEHYGEVLYRDNIEKPDAKAEKFIQEYFL